MVLIRDTDSLVRRFAPYIQELHAVFAEHNLYYGSPEDLMVLTQRLSAADAFPGELASMVRSFIFRERGMVSQEEMLGIVALSVGGFQVERKAPQLQEQLRKLSDFLSKAIRPSFDQSAASEPTTQAVDFAAAVLASKPSETPETTPQNIPEKSFPPVLTGNIVSPIPITPNALLARGPSAILISGRSPWVWGAFTLLVFLIAAGLFHRRSRASASTHASTSYASTPLATKPSGSSSVISPSTPTIYGAVPSTLASPSSPSALRANISSAPSLSSTSLPIHNQNQPTGPSQVNPSTSQHQHYPRTSSSAELLAEQQSISARVEPLLVATAPEPPSAPGPAPVSTQPSSTSALPPRPTTTHAAPVHKSSLNVSSGFMTAHLLSAPQPEYPKFASMTHVEGPVIVQAIVAKDGSVAAVKVLRGHHLLRGAAINAVSQWRYRPYLSHGQPVDVATIVTINFKLHH